MVRPVRFAFNEQTAADNAFQVQGADAKAQVNALSEFNAFVQKLHSAGVDVTVVDDTPEPHTPDAVFPNNWISFHENGTVVLYPMFAENRRLERKTAILDEVRKKFVVRSVADLSPFEEQGKFLEGTGSIVLDRDKMIAYACISARTDRELFHQFCRDMHYHSVAFTGADPVGRPIYHTNVMMCVADSYVVVCTECIPDTSEREHVKNTIRNSGKEIIEISWEQVRDFAGNMLQVENTKKQKYLVMSTRAYRSLTDDQLDKLNRYNPIIHSPLDSIERNGGGSARCMMAEVFLTPLKKDFP